MVPRQDSNPRPVNRKPIALPLVQLLHINLVIVMLSQYGRNAGSTVCAGKNEFEAQRNKQVYAETDAIWKVQPRGM